MTGLGQAQCERDGVVVAVEVRTVNHRYFKLACRTTDGYGSLEPRIERLVRRHVRRGSVQVDVRVEHQASPEDFKLNEIVLDSYRRQLEAYCSRMDITERFGLDALLLLPGVAEESTARRADADAVWLLVEQALDAALENLARMRADEGASMAADLRANCRAIAEQLNAIEARAPRVVEAYRQRLTERLNRLLEEYEISIEAADVVREVGVFADRSDISEEIVRLRSHLKQFDTLADADPSSGRKLEFLIQEMLRETNTIGSKANDAEIAGRVIEIKAAIERMREMIQNVE